MDIRLTDPISYALSTAKLIKGDLFSIHVSLWKRLYLCQYIYEALTKWRYKKETEQLETKVNKKDKCMLRGHTTDKNNTGHLLNHRTNCSLFARDVKK